MAATFKVRSGAAFKAHIRYHTPEDALVDTTGSTVRLQVRAIGGASRVLVDVTEGTDILTLIEPGHWRIFFGKSLTKRLPPAVSCELELTVDANEEDVTALGSWILKVEPENVINAE